MLGPCRSCKNFNLHRSAHNMRQICHVLFFTLKLLYLVECVKERGGCLPSFCLLLRRPLQTATTAKLTVQPVLDLEADGDAWDGDRLQKNTIPGHAQLFTRFFLGLVDGTSEHANLVELLAASNEEFGEDATEQNKQVEDSACFSEGLPDGVNFALVRATLTGNYKRYGAYSHSVVCRVPVCLRRRLGEICGPYLASVHVLEFS